MWPLLQRSRARARLEEIKAASKTRPARRPSEPPVELGVLAPVEVGVAEGSVPVLVAVPVGWVPVLVAVAEGGVKPGGNVFVAVGVRVIVGVRVMVGVRVEVGVRVIVGVRVMVGVKVSVGPPGVIVGCAGAALIVTFVLADFTHPPASTTLSVRPTLPEAPAV